MHLWKTLPDQWGGEFTWLPGHTHHVTMRPAGSCGILERTLVKGKPTMPLTLRLLVHGCLSDDIGVILFTPSHVNGGRIPIRNPETRASTM